MLVVIHLQKQVSESDKFPLLVSKTDFHAPEKLADVFFFISLF